MSDLISRTAAIGAFTGKPPEYYHTSYIVSELNSVPAVDAVPVVRCEDCKYWGQDDPAGDGCECNHIGGWWLPEEYCSCGERREADG